MWLDRFSGPPNASGSSTPSNRPYSPARKSSGLTVPGQLGRPSYSPRSSSLSLLTTPNASSSSLPGATPQKNGSSNPKYEETVAEDPLCILQGIIGKQPSLDNQEDVPARVSASEKPTELVETIDFGDLSLEEYLQQDNNTARSDNRLSSIQTGEQCKFCYP